MLIPLTLNKTVTLHNYRLKVCFNVVMISFIVACVAGFILKASWASYVTSEEGFRFSIWIPPIWNQTKVNTLHHAKSTLPICRGSVNMTSTFTAEVPTSTGCTKPFPRADIESLGENHVFFPTAVERWNYSKSGNESTMHEIAFTPYEEVYHFNMVYNYDLTVLSLYDFLGSSSFAGSSTSNTLTILLDSKNERRRVIHPKTSIISISLVELFDLAGKPHLLDDVQPSLSHGDQFGGPIGRLSGIEVTMKFACYESISNLGKHAEGLSWKGNVCTVKSKAESPSWVRKMYVHDSQMLSFTSVSGVRVKMVAQARIWHLHPEQLFGWISNTYVLLKFPRLLFRMIISNCLGKLSAIYSAAYREDFILQHHVCSLVIDMMSRNVVFHFLCGRDPGITLTGMRRNMVESLQSFEELDVLEIHAFVLFFFAMAYDTERWKRHELKRTITGSLSDCFGGGGGILRKRRRHSSSEVLENVHLDLTSFIAASAMSRTVFVEHMVQLFDQDRHMGLGEHFFMPSFMREHIMGAREQMADDQAKSIYESTLRQSEEHEEEDEHDSKLEQNLLGCKSAEQQQQQEKLQQEKLQQEKLQQELKQEMHQQQDLQRKLNEEILERLRSIEASVDKRLELQLQVINERMLAPSALFEIVAAYLAPGKVTPVLGHGCSSEECKMQTKMRDNLSIPPQPHHLAAPGFPIEPTERSVGVFVDSIKQTCRMQVSEQQALFQENLSNLSEAVRQCTVAMEEHKTRITALSHRLWDLEDDRASSFATELTMGQDRSEESLTLVSQKPQYTRDVRVRMPRISSMEVRQPGQVQFPPPKYPKDAHYMMSPREVLSGTDVPSSPKMSPGVMTPPSEHSTSSDSWRRRAGLSSPTRCQTPSNTPGETPGPTPRPITPRPDPVQVKPSKGSIPAVTTRTPRVISRAVSQTRPAATALPPARPAGETFFAPVLMRVLGPSRSRSCEPCGTEDTRMRYCTL